MTATFPFPVFGLSGHDFRLAGLLIVLPILLAAGLMEKSARDNALPEADTYRSPFPDTILKSQGWRSPQIEKRDWRLPPPPPVGWRTTPTPESEASSSPQNFDLFPRYQPGAPSNYDMIEREEKPLIKMFEFGSK